MKRLSSIGRPAQPVIPAHAGIQVWFAELAWIPAFAGMTNPGCLFASRTGIFEGDDKNNW